MSKYKLSSAERETCIRWDMATNTAVIDTADPKFIRRLKKLCEEHPDIYAPVSENMEYGTFRCEVSSKYISFRKPPSEKQREAARRNAQNRVAPFARKSKI